MENALNQERKQPTADPLAPVTCYAAFDDEYPIIAELGCGWLLVAHENGPAIGKRGEQLLSSPLHTDEETPKWVNAKAIDKLMDWCAKQPTWPKRHNDGAKLRAPQPTDNPKP